MFSIAQVVEGPVPMDAWDEWVDYIITADAVLECKPPQQLPAAATAGAAPQAVNEGKAWPPSC